MALRPALVQLLPLQTPWKRRFLMVTTSLAPAETFIPLVPATRTEATWPPPPSIVIDLVMVSAPNPPGSSASISPPAAVFDMAPAKVLQGAVRLQGFASSPTPDTQVRVACALARQAKPNTNNEIDRGFTFFVITSIVSFFSELVSFRRLGRDSKSELVYT